MSVPLGCQLGALGNRVVRGRFEPTRVVPVQVQWMFFNGSGVAADAPIFRLDDWSLTIESAISSCK